MEPLAEDCRVLVVTAMLRAGHLRGLETLRLVSSEYHASVRAVLRPSLTWLVIASPDGLYGWHARSEEWTLATELDAPLKVDTTYHEMMHVPLADDPTRSLLVACRATERVGAEMEEWTLENHLPCTFGLAGGHIRQVVEDGCRTVVCGFFELPIYHVVDTRCVKYTGPMGADGDLVVEPICVTCPNCDVPHMRNLALGPHDGAYGLARYTRDEDGPWLPVPTDILLSFGCPTFLREIVADLSSPGRPRLLFRFIPGAAELINTRFEDGIFPIPF